MGGKRTFGTERLTRLYAWSIQPPAKTDLHLSAISEENLRFALHGAHVDRSPANVAAIVAVYFQGNVNRKMERLSGCPVSQTGLITIDFDGEARF